MKVRELIQKLQDMPPEATVYTTDDTDGELLCDWGAGVMGVELDESLSPTNPDVVLKFESEFLKLAIQQDHLDNDGCGWKES